MKAEGLAITTILDDAEALASRRVAPWLGLLWLTSLPLRLLQAHFLDRVVELGASADRYGTYLGEISIALSLAFLPALWGRAVYSRACSLALSSGRSPGREALRLPPGPALNYLYLAWVLELGFVGLALLFVPIPVFILLAGLAAASWEFTGSPSLVRPLRVLASHGRALRPILGILLLMPVVFAVVWINLFALTQALLWLGQGVVGLELGRWQALLSFDNRPFLLLVSVGAWLLVEPFWLAVCAVYVRAVRARTSGEDLRLWWAELQSREEVAEVAPP